LLFRALDEGKRATKLKEGGERKLFLVSYDEEGKGNTRPSRPW